MLIERGMGVKKKFIVIGLILLIVLISVGAYFFISENEKKEKEKSKEELINNISNHYNTYVITNKETSIYEYINNEYVEIVKLNKDIPLELLETNIDENTLYFKVKNDNEKELFIKYEDVSISEKKEKEKDTRYLSYIPFNESVILNETKLYKDDTWLYQISNIELPILKKDSEKYYVEFAGELLSVLKNEVDVKENINTTLNNASGIRVLVYHSFYKPGVETDCTSSICHPEEEFRSHLAYLKENNYFTPTMAELESYIDGNLRLPEKSVMITIDDGWLAERGLNLLHEYELNGTLFLITSWYDKESYIDSPYVEFHSHGHDLHRQGVCPGGQGGAIKCVEKSKLLEDLSASRSELNNSTAFCYPFYEYNAYSIEVLKEAGFTMAFGGYSENGQTLVKVGSDKYRLPRYTIVKGNDVNHLKSVLKK